MMVKDMKKFVLCFCLISCFIMGIWIIPSKADNKTLQDLLNDLAKIEEEYNRINEEKKITEERLNEIISRMTEIGLRINDIENLIISIQNDIEKINIDIVAKNEEIKRLANILQKNNGDNLYLEFLFGSESLTDFIYRTKAIEQMTTYNEKLVEDYEKMLDEVKVKQEELNREKENLDVENKKLTVEQNELGMQMNVLDEDSRDILEDIADARRVINNYKKMGCTLNDTLEDCSSIPADSAFLRPVTQGVITSGYGTRKNPVADGYQFHAAIDIGGNPTGTSVYAAASGVVVLAYTVPNPNIPNSSCGGNHVIIQHKIGNVYYATRYMHLNKVYVTENQKVTANDIIGAVGGGEIYDRCTTGAHLDFSIAKGIYGKDFYLFRQPYTINPYTLINFPTDGTYYLSRYQKY